MIRTTALVVVGVLARTASAGTDPGYELGQVANWVLEAKADYRQGASSGPSDKACPTALAAMRKGVVASYNNKNLEKFGGVADKHRYKFTISRANAEKLCKEAAFLRDVVLEEFQLFSGMAIDIALLDDPSNGAGLAKVFGEKADRCVKAVDAMFAGGVKASFPYVLKDSDGKVITKTAGEIKPKVCEVTRRAAHKQVQAVDAEAKAYDARLTGAGLAGDKFEWFKHYDGQVFLAGGAAPDDLKKYAAAGVWFAFTYSSNPDKNGNHEFVVRRYQFAGSKLANSSEQTYSKPLEFKTKIGSVMK